MISLIFAGWIPHDLASSWTCPNLVTGVSVSLPIPSRRLGGSPNRDRTSYHVLEFCLFKKNRTNLTVADLPPPRMASKMHVGGGGKIGGSFAQISWAIAQENPTISLAIAVFIKFAFFPRATNCWYRLQSLTCAFQAISLTLSGTSS